MDDTSRDFPTHCRAETDPVDLSAASWSERASNEASSALASAPGVAEEEAGRQGAPEPGDGVIAAHAATPRVEQRVDPRTPVEQPSWREPDDPPLPALMNRKRTREKRDQVKNIRFTPTAVRTIAQAADQQGQKFAGFVGDAALAAALGNHLLGSPEDDPVRPLAEAIGAHIVALNRVGRNLNQITAAIHRGTIPEHAELVLDRIDDAVGRSYRLMDQLLAEDFPHGA